MNDRSDERTGMSAQKPIGLLGILAVVLLAAGLAAGCGVGKASNEEKISKTATTYLRALADGDGAKACLQLSRHARGERCEQALKQRLSRLDPDALRKAADGSMDIGVNGNRATASWSEPQPAHFVLVKVGAEWRIDSGYTLG
jgi:hypothetical protein